MKVLAFNDHVSSLNIDQTLIEEAQGHFLCSFLHKGGHRKEFALIEFEEEKILVPSSKSPHNFMIHLLLS